MTAERGEIGGNRGTSEQPSAPLLWPALGLAAGIALADAGVAGQPVLLAVGLLVVGGAVAWWGLRGGGARRRVVNAGLLAVFVGAGVGRYLLDTTLPAEHVGRRVAAEPTLTRVIAEVVTPPRVRDPVVRNPFRPFQEGPRTEFIARARSFVVGEGREAARGLLRVTVKGAVSELTVGDEVELTGWLYAPAGPRNPAERDWRQWRARQQIYAGISVPGVEQVVVGERGGGGWRVWLEALRGVSRRMLIEPGALAGEDDADRLREVMVLGRRSVAPEALDEAFKRTGTAHYLAVSGFHVGILAVVAWWVGRRLWRRPAGAAWGVMGVLVLYALVVEPNPPALRAVVAGVAACVGMLLRRRFVALNWLALAAVVLLLWTPQALFSAGFQLSFVVVLALLLVMPRIAAWWRALWRDDWTLDDARGDVDTVVGLVGRRVGAWVGGLLAVSAVAWLASAPLLLLHFGKWTPLGPVYSALVAPPAIVTIVSGFLAAVLGWVPWLGDVLRGASHWAADGLVNWVTWLARGPGTAVTLPSPPWWLVVGTYVTLFAGLMWPGRGPVVADGGGERRRGIPGGRWWGRGAVAGTLLAAWGGWWLWLTPNAATGTCRLVVLAVGDGAAQVLITPSGRAVVIDAGTIENIDVGEKVAEALRTLGVREVAGVVVSHANFDHYSGLPTLMAAVRPAAWWVDPYFEHAARTEYAARRLMRLLPDGHPTPQALAAGDTLQLDGVRLEVVWPPAGLDTEAWGVNDRSLVLRVEAFGRRMLLTGDIEADALRALLDGNGGEVAALGSDVLLAPHHGGVEGEATAALLAAVDPAVIVVSSKDWRERFARMAAGVAAGGTLYGTARDGAVVVEVRPDGGLRVEAPWSTGQR